MNKERKSPKLRFKDKNNQEFPNWEEKKLKYLTTINPNNEPITSPFYYIDLESVVCGKCNFENILNISNSPSRAQRTLMKNDVLFQTVRPYQKNNYIHKKEKDLMCVASTGYALLRTEKSSYFLYQLINSQRFNKKVLLRCTGSNYPSINTKDLSQIVSYVPQDIKEQEKIGQFFSKIDEQIEQQENKIRLLEKQKQGLMQKIFTQEIRFKDSEGKEFPTWEEKRLEEYVTLQNGYAFKSELFQDNGIPIVRISNIDEVISLEKNNTVFYPLNLKINKSFEVNKGDLLVAMSGATTGKTGIYRLDEKSYLNQRIGNFKIKQEKQEKVFYPYLYCLIKSNSYKKELKKSLVAGAQPNISSQDIEKMKFHFPCFKEQEKIAQVLSKFDELIEKEKQLLEQQKQMKKGLLQQMFV